MKKAKNLLRLSAYLLISALLFSFGSGTLRAQDTYTLVKSMDDLSENDKVIIVAATADRAMSSVQSSNNRAEVEITKKDETIQPGTTVGVFTIKNGTKTNTFAFHDENGYLCSASSSSNYLRSEASLSDNSSWTITITTAGVATVTAQGTYSRKVMQYNSSSKIFACYASASQAGVSIYKKQEATPTTDPYVRAEKEEVSYKIQPTENLNETLSFTAGNLENDLTVSVASATAGNTPAITVNPTTISKDQTSFTLSITTTGLAKGEYSDIITIKSEENTMASVTVNLSVKKADVYQLVTDVASLNADDVVLIVGTGEGHYAMTATTTSSKRGAVEVTVANGTVSNPDIADAGNTGKACEFTLLKKADGEYAFHDLVNGEYLQGATGNTNTSSGPDAYYFMVSISAQGKASIKAQETSGRLIRHFKSASNNDFRSYADETNGSDIQLYKKLPSCSKVSNVTVVLDSLTTAKLNWTAPEQAPAEGYKVNITRNWQNQEVVKDAAVPAGTTEYTCTTLERSNEYTYSIVSVCGEGDESQAVTGTFKTKKAVCPQAKNITATVTEDNSLKLDWTEPAEVVHTDTSVVWIPLSYRITIDTASPGWDMEGGGASKPIEARVDYGTGHTYTSQVFPAGVYKYDFYPVCHGNVSGIVKTDNFTITAADAKSLAVSLTGNTDDSEHYTGSITFNFQTKNFILGTDGKVKYSIIGDKQEVDGTTAENSITLDLLSGVYIAEFELVDTDGNSLDPKVSDEAEFTVDLPDVAAPAFSLDEQTAAFTEEKTLTLSCTTEGASIYYSLNEADFTEYAEAIHLDKSGTFTISAFAAKEKMDTSATISKSYTLKLPQRVDNLKAIYGKAKGDTLLVVGKMVVTHKDSTTNPRVWVQDIDKENGASMLLYKVTPAKGFSDLKVGDVLQNVVGEVDNYNGLVEFIPSGKLVAVEHGHAVYVDTLTVDYINTNITTLQSALVCVEEVTFTPGKFSTAKNERITTLNQGDKTIQFYTSFVKADYIGENTPEGLLNVTGILGNNNGTAQITARSKADMVEVLVCEEVKTVSCEIDGTTALFGWEVENAPAVGYIIEVRTDNEAQTLVKRDTVKNPSTLTYRLENLAEGNYTYSITSLCGEGNTAEPVSDNFTVAAAGQPSMVLIKPAAGEFDRDSVMFTCKVRNFVLGTGADAAGSIKYTLRGTNLPSPVTATITDTFFYYKFARSGMDTVTLELVDKSGAALTPAVKVRRAFEINLPDVADPVFAPEATALDTVTDVTLSCATDGATIYYSLNDADFTAYAQPIKLDANGTYNFKAFAVKAKMDTSAVATKTYTLRLPVEIEGEIVFEEPFDKITVTSDGSASIEGELDKYTNMPGWSGQNVYQGQGGCVKFGTSSKMGYLQTPAIDLSTNEGKFILAFDAKAYNNENEKESIKLVVNGEEQTIDGLPKDEMKQFVFAFTSGTASTTIRFSAVNASKNRFYLDNVRIYQVLPDVPRLSISSNLFDMNTVQGTPVSQKITVNGHKLESDVTVSCPQGNFSVSAATLTKEAVMAENGAELSITFNGSIAADSVVVKLESGDLRDSVKVRAFAATVTEVNNIAALRAAPQGSLYKIKGEVILTAQDANRNSKWIEDESGAILIDDATGLVTTSYEVGDGITGVYGKLGNHRGQLQLVMTGNLPEASSHNNTIEPQVITVKELTESIDTYCSRLVRINGLTLENATGTWTVETSKASDESGTIDIYPFVRNGNFIGTDKPEGKFDLIALAGIYDGTVQVSPRTTEDIIAAGVEPEKDTVKTPVFTPASGTTLKIGDLITINCATEGAAIYYTLDGSTPTTASQRYTDGIKMNADKLTVKAFAVMEGMQDSKVAEASYTTPVANEDKENLNVRIYPNPNDGLFFVEVAEAVRMEIFNLSGLNLRTLELAAGKTEINLPQSGVYFIRLSNAQATIVKRVVVR